MAKLIDGEPLRALVVGTGIAGERHALAQAKLGVPTFPYYL